MCLQGSRRGRRCSARSRPPRCCKAPSTPTSAPAASCTAGVSYHLPAIGALAAHVPPQVIPARPAPVSSRITSTAGPQAGHDTTRQGHNQADHRPGDRPPRPIRRDPGAYANRKFLAPAMNLQITHGGPEQHRDQQAHRYYHDQPLPARSVPRLAGCVARPAIRRLGCVSSTKGAAGATPLCHVYRLADTRVSVPLISNSKSVSPSALAYQCHSILSSLTKRMVYLYLQGSPLAK